MKKLFFIALCTLFLYGCFDTKVPKENPPKVEEVANFKLISTEFVQWGENRGYRVSVIKDMKYGVEYFVLSDGYGLTVTKR